MLHPCSHCLAQCWLTYIPCRPFVYWTRFCTTGSTLLAHIHSPGLTPSKKVSISHCVEPVLTTFFRSLLTLTLCKPSKKAEDDSFLRSSLVTSNDHSIEPTPINHLACCPTWQVHSYYTYQTFQEGRERLIPRCPPWQQARVFSHFTGGWLATQCDNVPWLTTTCHRLPSGDLVVANQAAALFKYSPITNQTYVNIHLWVTTSHHPS